ncbi:MAG: hypothetical protein EBS89_12370 [Proteobacteria bacterium]|nr:hypothetical protein [Pseudomonadota bacterium]
MAAMMATPAELMTHSSRRVRPRRRLRWRGSNWYGGTASAGSSHDDGGTLRPRRDRGTSRAPRPSAARSRGALRSRPNVAASSESGSRRIVTVPNPTN